MAAKSTKKATDGKPSAKKGASGRKRKSDVSPENFTQLVRERAYQLFEQRNYVHGHDQADWFAAEELVRAGK